MRMLRRKHKRQSVFYSAQVGIDRAIIGFRIDLPDGTDRHTSSLRQALERLFGDTFIESPLGFTLPLHTGIRNSKGIRGVQNDSIFVPRKFKPVVDKTTGEKKPGVVYFIIQTDLSCIREAAFMERASIGAADRTRLEDFHKSFPPKRRGDDENKFFPLNAMNPKVRGRAFVSRQWKIMREATTRLEKTTSSIVSALEPLFANQTLRVRPFVRRLEIPQDVFFKSSGQSSPLIFERMAFVCRLMQDNLLCKKSGRFVARYPRAITEYDFARSPIKRIPYRHNYERMIELRSSNKYKVEAVVTWIKKHVVPSVYFCTPLNLKDSVPSIIAFHAYPGVRVPGDITCDLFRIEPRFLNRLGSTDQNLMQLVRQFHRQAVDLFPRDIDFELIQTQRPLTLHRLMYGVCRSVGLSQTDYQTLCKGGAIRIRKRQPNFGEFKSFFEQRRRKK